MSAVLLAGARTPIGKMSGGLSSFSAVELGGFAIEAALERAGVAPEDVDYVFMGQVLLAGLDDAYLEHGRMRSRLGPGRGLRPGGTTARGRAQLRGRRASGARPHRTRSA